MPASSSAESAWLRHVDARANRGDEVCQIARPVGDEGERHGTFPCRLEFRTQPPPGVAQRGVRRPCRDTSSPFLITTTALGPAARGAARRPQPHKYKPPKRPAHLK